jgi:hypothetical protein
MLSFFTTEKYTSLEEFATDFNETYDYKYIMTYDYDSYRDCQNGSNCCDNDYCRCSKITNFSIKCFRYDQIINKISKLPLLDQYVIHRLFTFYDLPNIQNFNPIIVSSYYGEELDAIQLDPTIKTTISNHLISLTPLSNIDKILYSLNIEYDIPATSLSNYKFAEVISIPINDIKYTPYLLNKYNDQIDYFLPRGIIIKDDNLYTIIDGHKKISQDIRNEKLEIQVILLS